MKHITLALDEGTLDAARADAQRHGTTLNALVRELLVKTVVADREAAVREMFRLMDAHPGRAPRKRWTREDLHGG
jgi:plasmid stability protein